MAPVVFASFPRTLSTCTRYNRNYTSLLWGLRGPQGTAACGVVARHKSTAATLADDEGPTIMEPQPEAGKKKDRLDLTFWDHESAFRSKTTKELLRAIFVFQMCGIETLVTHNMKLIRFGQKVLGNKLFGKIMKGTFYGHFVAGEDQIRIQPCLERLRSFGVKSILDYSAEEDVSEEKAEELEMEALTPRQRGADGTTGTSSEADDSLSCETVDEKAMNWNETLHSGTIERFTPQRKFADRRQNVSGARTYFYVNEAQCEKNMETFLNCIDAVSDATHGTGFAAIKMTALGRPQLLMQLSEVISKTRDYFEEVTGHKGPIIGADLGVDVFEKRFKTENILTPENPEVERWIDNMTYDKKSIIHLFSWSGLIDTNILLTDMFKVPNLKTGTLEPLISALTREEEEMFKNMMRRLHTIFQYAKERDVRVMVDAEQTYFQDAISRLTLEMMKKYNTEKAIVFNTYQCYLKETLDNLTLDLEQSYRQNFYFGAKLVRGAYMEQERARAEELGYEDPVNPSYEATTEMYHNCLKECLRRIKLNKEKTSEDTQRFAIMVASHNEDTVRYTVRKMEEFNIKPLDRVICFGQLLGMCDHISLPLGQAGYSVYKYVPYGPVDEVLPYLSRRAAENGSILVKLKKEKKLLWRELGRRMVKGQLFYTPKGDYIPIGATKVQ